MKLNINKVESALHWRPLIPMTRMSPTDSLATSVQFPHGCPLQPSEAQPPRVGGSEGAEMRMNGGREGKKENG